jgi:hypothetical protein
MKVWRQMIVGIDPDNDLPNLVKLSHVASTAPQI